MPADLKKRLTDRASILDLAGHFETDSPALIREAARRIEDLEIALQIAADHIDGGAGTEADCAMAGRLKRVLEGGSDVHGG